jgi:cytochrome P450
MAVPPAIPEARLSQALFAEPGRTADELKRKHGPLTRLRLKSGASFLFATGVDAHKTFLVDHLDRVSNYEGWNWVGPSAVAIGKGIVFMDGEEHRWFRQAMTPGFQPAAVASYLPLIHDVVRARIASWPEDGVIGLYPEVSAMTFHVTAGIVLGMRDARRVGELHVLYRDVMLWRDPRPAIDAMRPALAAAVLATIRERMAEPAGDLLSQIIAAGGPDGRPLSEDEILSQVNTLMVAGHFTASALASYLLLMLHGHPSFFSQLVVEQDGANAEDMEGLSRMTLLDRALLEAERMIAPIPHLPRGVTQDIEFAGHTIRAGEFLFCSVAGTHRDERLYDDPHRFDPDRFAPPRNERRRDRLALAGFSVGPRRCLGTLLAQVMIKIIIHHIVRNFTFEPQREAYAPSVSLPICHPTNPMPVRVRARGARRVPA